MDIKTRISMDGVQQYKRDMRTAEQSVKTLRAEMMEAASQYELTGDKEEYAKEKTRILQEQIAAQKTVVENAKKALEQLTKDGVDPASKQFQTMRAQVANAQTQLNNMQRDLQNTTTDFTDAATEAGSFGSAIKNIDKNVSFESIRSGLDSISQKMMAVTKQAINLGKGVWNGAVDASTWADDLITTATQYGLDTETLQRWEYASALVDTEVDTILNMRYKIAQAMNAEGDAVGEAYSTLEDGALAVDNTDNFSVMVGTTMTELQKLGVSITDEAGNIKDTNTVFWETIDALGAMDSATEQERVAMELFGRRYAELIPLIEAGKTGWDEWANSAPIIPATTVQTLGSFNDEVEKTNALLDNIKLTAYGGLAESFSSISESINTILRQFNDFLQSAEGQSALKELGTAIQSIFDSLLGKEENGNVDFSSIVSRATNAVKGLNNVMSWIAENGDTIAGILTAWGIGLAGLKVGTGVLDFAKIVVGAKGVFGGGAAAAAAPAAAAVPAAAAAPASTAAGQAFASSIGANATLTGLGAWVPAATAATVGLGTIATLYGAAMGIPSTLESMKGFHENRALFSTNAPITQKVDTRAGSKLLWAAMTGDSSGLPEVSAEQKAALAATEEMRRNARADLWRGDVMANAEAWYDATRNWNATGMGLDSMHTAWGALQELFGNNGDELDTMADIIEQAMATGAEDIPDAVWEALNDMLTGIQTGIRNGDKNGITFTDEQVARIEAAVHDGVSGITVELDGEAVGRLVTPEVSGQIGSMLIGQ